MLWTVFWLAAGGGLAVLACDRSMPFGLIMYGHGQVLLAADQGLMVVISEKGELILLQVDSQKLVERGRLQALAGKTWNHPVIAGSRLLVRNAEEMACYELAEADSGSGGQ